MNISYARITGWIQAARNKFRKYFGSVAKTNFRQTLLADLKDAYRFYLDEEHRGRLAKMNHFRKWMFASIWIIRSMMQRLTTTRRVLLIFGMILGFQYRSDQNRESIAGALLLLLVIILELKDKLLAFDELNEARKLQLSMLPKDVPETTDIDIAFFMKTANHVGGDYYDFRRLEDGTLFLTVGDATGHGLKAGILVAIIKSLFCTIGMSTSIPEFFNKCTQVIQGMSLEPLYMAMILARIKDHSITVSVAGMPPLLLFKKTEGIIKEISAGGMPLGFIEFDFEETNLQLEPGDTILLMTDGLPELFNSNEEMFDYPKVKELFKSIALMPPKQIIEQLSNAAETWKGEQPQEDDITFAVLQAKTPLLQR